MLTATTTKPRDFSELAREHQAAVDDAALLSFARSLGVSAESLKHLGIGRHRDTWVFPERDADGRIIGLSRRLPDGKKIAVNGSRRGLTMRWPIDGYAGSSPNDPILIVEGATCTAAGLDLGFTTIGRPSARGGVDHLRPLLKDRHVVISGENDAGAGRLGADKIAQAIVGDASSVKIIFPPACDKDLRDWAQHASRDEIETAIREADRVQLPPLAGLPTIIINNRQLRDVASDTLKAIEQGNNPPVIFVRNGSLARVRQDEDGRPLIDTVGEDDLRHRAGRCANFIKVLRQDGVKAAPPPLGVVKDILAAEKTWPFPALLGVTETPVLRPDGSVLDRPGYDSGTRLVYVPTASLSIPAIPNAPTQTDAKEAAKFILDEVLVDFPFVADGQDGRFASRANMLGTELTPVVRPTIDGPTPLHVIDAPIAGSGKGLLSSVIAFIATGRPSAVISAPESDAEMRKAITAALLSGSSVLSIDNITVTLRWSSLSAAITASVWDDRILGVSKTCNVPVKVTWLVNGNNVRLGGDLPRRAVWIRIDPKHARPWERSGFRHPQLLRWVAQHRGEIVAALLTMARAWHVAGRPTSEPSIGSFESWSEVIGGILAFAGVPGFLENRNDMLEQADEDAPEWEAFLLAWQDEFGDEAVTTAQVADRLDAALAADLRAALPGHLADALTNKAKSFTRRLGRALAAVQDRRFNDAGLRVTRAAKDEHKNVQTWKVIADG